MKEPKIVTRILHNQAFLEICKLKKSNPGYMERIVLNRMISEDLIDLTEISNCGETLVERAEKSGYDSQMLLECVFPCNPSNREIKELLSSAYLWGNAEESPCKECGSQMNYSEAYYTEQGDEIDIYKCANPGCRGEDHVATDNEVMIYKSYM